MKRLFPGLFMTLLILAMIFFTAWMLNNLKLIDIKPVVLGGAARLANLPDLEDSYALGTKRSAVLVQREKELATREQNLQKSQATLDSDRNTFETEKLQWEKTHMVNGQPIPASGSMTGKNVPGSKTDPQVQQFLVQVGGMQPAKAAAVLQSLPDETVFQIFDQLRASQVTKIMEKLPPDYLARLTKERIVKNP